MSSEIGQSLPHFIKKAYDILQNQEYRSIIAWLPSSKEFAIKDINAFQTKVLPLHFRHNNVHSFVRQLNMYGFHKNRKDPSKNIFSHPAFRKDHEELLSQIKRKNKAQQPGSEHSTQKQSQLKIETATQNFSKPEQTLFKTPVACRKFNQQQELIPLPSNNKISLNLMIYPSEVMNDNPDVYSNLRVEENLFLESDSQNVSIEDEIEKERKVSLALRSGVSLVQTRHLLQTQLHLRDDL